MMFLLLSCKINTLSKHIILHFQIWTSLDCEDYLSASRLFLLSQHINTSLQLDSQHAPNFLYWFPVLNRQWAAISHFKLTILQGCRRTLKEPSASDQVFRTRKKKKRRNFNVIIWLMTRYKFKKNKVHVCFAWFVQVFYCMKHYSVACFRLVNISLCFSNKMFWTGNNAQRSYMNFLCW